MKNTFKLTILILIISVYASCVKTSGSSVGGGSNNDTYIKDTSTFITLNYKGRTLNFNGVKSVNNDSLLNQIYNLYLWGKVEVGNNGNGSIEYQITINAMKGNFPGVIQQLDLIAGGRIVSSNPLGSYKISSDMFKDYTLLIPTSFGMTDGGPGEIKISSIDGKYITGSFQFNKNIDADGVSTFPATGSFKVNRLY
jgi:hypothetical protein